jgi:hypothetical protein
MGEIMNQSIEAAMIEAQRKGEFRQLYKDTQRYAKALKAKKLARITVDPNGWAVAYSYLVECERRLMLKGYDYSQLHRMRMIAVRTYKMDLL